MPGEHNREGTKQNSWYGDSCANGLIAINGGMLVTNDDQPARRLSGSTIIMITDSIVKHLCCVGQHCNPRALNYHCRHPDG